MFYVFLIRFFEFLKRNRFLFFFRKIHKNAILIVFIASCNITIFRITQLITFYTYYGIQI